MKKILFVAALAISTSILVGGSTTAMAGKSCSVNCSDPVKGKRNGNWWKVKYCVVGKGTSRRKVDCRSPEAVHKLPNGYTGVCFIGSDKNREHYAAQANVWVGRYYFNMEVETEDGSKVWKIYWKD